jgi:hypothetical protein
MSATYILIQHDVGHDELNSEVDSPVSVDSDYSSISNWLNKTKAINTVAKVQLFNHVSGDSLLAHWCDSFVGFAAQKQCRETADCEVTFIWICED